MIAAREAVGLPPLDDDIDGSKDAGYVDECLVWSPTTEGVCLHWKSDHDPGYQQKVQQQKFNRAEMEGTRNPRRGGSGTAR